MCCTPTSTHRQQTRNEVPIWPSFRCANFLCHGAPHVASSFSFSATWLIQHRICIILRERRCLWVLLSALPFFFRVFAFASWRKDGTESSCGTTWEDANMGTDSPVIAGYRQRPDLSLRNTLDFTSIGVNPSSYQDGTQPIHQNLGPIMMVLKQQQNSQKSPRTSFSNQTKLSDWKEVRGADGDPSERPRYLEFRPGWFHRKRPRQEELLSVKKSMKTIKENGSGKSVLSALLFQQSQRIDPLVASMPWTDKQVAASTHQSTLKSVDLETLAKTTYQSGLWTLDMAGLGLWLKHATSILLVHWFHHVMCFIWPDLNKFIWFLKPGTGAGNNIWWHDKQCQTYEKPKMGTNQNYGYFEAFDPSNSQGLFLLIFESMTLHWKKHHQVRLEDRDHETSQMIPFPVFHL